MDDKNWILIISVIAVPVLAALTQWINTKLMPQMQSNNSGSKKAAEEENPMVSSMKTMNTIMPLMSAFFCFSLPIGMGIYWITGSIVRSIIQIVVNKYLDKMDIDEMIKKNVEKQNEKRRKQGLPVQQISSNAKLNTKNAGKNDNNEKKSNVSDKTNVKKNLKDSSEYSNKNTSKSGSLASKANMVKEFNEKNNSKKD
jgi:YidC/Oxa1 family membrane protein insertase